MATYFHVAPNSYNEGEDLLSWDAYTERFGETPGAWKWDEAEEGFDTDIVCVFRGDQRDAAVEFIEMWMDGSAKLLTIEIPEDAMAEVRMGVNEEGFDYVARMIPAEFIVAVEEIG